MANKDNKDQQPSPDDVFGPKIADNMSMMAEAIATESGASTVYVSATFVFKKGAAGKMKLDIQVSPDASKERIADGTLTERGSKLQVDVDGVIKELMSKLKDKGNSEEK